MEGKPLLALLSPRVPDIQLPVAWIIAAAVGAVLLIAGIVLAVVLTVLVRPITSGTT